MYYCTKEFFIAVTKNDVDEFNALAEKIFTELKGLSGDKRVGFLTENVNSFVREQNLREKYLQTAHAGAVFHSLTFLESFERSKLLDPR